MTWQLRWALNNRVYTIRSENKIINGSTHDVYYKRPCVDMAHYFFNVTEDVFMFYCLLTIVGLDK